MQCEPRVIKISERDDRVEFDVTNIDVSIANGLRRIMIAEVPTMAIERVLLEENSSCIPDEMLCHRLGLIPIYADPRKFNFPKDNKFTDATEEDTIVFELDVQCTLDKAKNKVHDKVFSGDLVWEPQGEQETVFAGDNAIRPVLDNILIAELQPYQRIKCRLYCCKGIGQDHAKFSPVCTAAYRMMPKISILKQDKKMAKTIKNCCPLNVFDIEDGELIVKNARNCKMCRECIRDEKSEFIKLGREENHFLFTVESTGIYKAKEIFVEAMNVMKQKAQKCLDDLEKKRSALNE